MTTPEQQAILGQSLWDLFAAWERYIASGGQIDARIKLHPDDANLASEVATDKIATSAVTHDDLAPNADEPTIVEAPGHE